MISIRKCCGKDISTSLIAGLISEEFDAFDVLRSATINPVEHYKLEIGLLRQGDSADFILVDSLAKMNVLETWIKGERVFAEGQVYFKYKAGKAVNNFNCLPLKDADIRVKNTNEMIRVITAKEGELLTGEIHHSAGNSDYISTDISEDTLKNSC